MTDYRARARLAAVLAFTCLLALPFLGKAFHIDEPFFLALAGQVRQDPLHPLTIDMDWRMDPPSVPKDRSPEPPLMPYLLAAALAVSGGKEWLTRLLFLPFDLAAAWGLFLLAARFLKRPLLPTLLVLASPAYLIDMGHLMPEKLCAAFGFWGLYLLLRGLDEDRRGLWAGSAALLAAAVMSKYHAVLFLLSAAWLCISRGAGLARTAGFLAAALAPLAALVGWDLCTGGAVLRVIRALTALGNASLWSGPVHTLRSLLSFTGGCGLAAAVWAALLLRRKPRVLFAALGAVALLFLPAWDAAGGVSALDRLTGILFASGALLGFFVLADRGLVLPGRPLWLSWVLAVVLLELFLYWGVLARVIMFLVPPLVFGLAEILEARWEERSLRRLYACSLAGTLVLSLGLAAVDFRYAGVQRAVARQVERDYAAAGKTVWFTGSWGLRYYLEKAGARPVLNAPGAWDAVGAGDVVVVSRFNANRPVPASFFLQGRLQAARLDSPIPLRLISGWGAPALASGSQAGFYSNGWGFLPFALSLEPVDEFLIRTPN
jgi:hypothetical protein